VVVLLRFRNKGIKLYTTRVTVLSGIVSLRFLAIDTLLQVFTSIGLSFIAKSKSPNQLYIALLEIFPKHLIHFGFSRFEVNRGLYGIQLIKISD